MAKATNVKLRGIIQWAKVFEQNRDMEGYEGAFEDCGGAYTVNLQMDEENYAKFQGTGSPKVGRKVGDLYEVKFIRKHEHPSIPDLGGAPGVYNEKGEPWDFDIDGVIPNGSEGTVLINVYPARKTKGTRLMKVQVLERGEFSGDSFLETGGSKPNKSKAKVLVPDETQIEDETLDDEIPF